jgi:orotate phosphoribosyltransferase
MMTERLWADRTAEAGTHQGEADVNYRSVADLNDDIVTWSRRLPGNINVIVGIPRSGLLVANLLALHMNLPMTDVDGLIEGRLIAAGPRLNATRPTVPDLDTLRVLVVDDSVWSGNQMRKIRERITAARLRHVIFYGAVYITPNATDLVDYYHEKVALPRAFEWNVLHHPSLTASCMAMEGVLWPAEIGRIDAAEGLRELRPIFAPTQPIGRLIATQPERLRVPIQEWLAHHRISYGELVLLDPTDSSIGRDEGCFVRAKASLYRHSNAWIFIEGTIERAAALAQMVRRPVYSACARRMLFPGRGGKERDMPLLRDRLNWRARDAFARAYRRIRALVQLSGDSRAIRNTSNR